jgi:hypothetical protein
MMKDSTSSAVPPELDRLPLITNPANLRIISRNKLSPSSQSLFSFVDQPALKPLLWLGLVAMLAASCVISLTQFSTADESWYLRVLQRITDGEVLYRDVYYPLLPLPVYVGVAATTVFGSNFHVLQALFFACFIASVWLCDSSARLLEIEPIPRLVLLLSLCVWASPAAAKASLYQPMATMFLLISLRMLLAWSRRTASGESSVELTIAATAAGAGFASKDQVGLLTLAALLFSVAIIFLHRRFAGADFVRAVARILIFFTGTVVLSLVPVVVQGGFGRFAEYFVVERAAVIRTSSIPYIEGIHHFLPMVRHPRAFFKHPFEAMNYSMFLIAPVLLAVLTWLWFRAGDDDQFRAATLLSFCVAAGLSIYPRADVWHVLFLSSMFVLALTFLADRLLTSRPVRGMLLGLFSLCLIAAFAEAIWMSTVRITRFDHQFLRLPHFEYAMAARAEIDQMKHDREMLQAAAAEGPVFLLTDEAGFYYLISGIKNPTSIDYPMVASMGRNGESDIIAAIQSDKNAWACVRSYREPLLRPARLEGYVRTQLQFVKQLGFCDLYRRTADENGKSENGN